MKRNTVGLNGQAMAVFALRSVADLCDSYLLTLHIFPVRYFYETEGKDKK